MPALSSCTILILGDFGHTPAKIKQWIKYHGGTQVTRLSDATTHLVCSAKNWKANHPTVLAAIKLDNAKSESKSTGNSKGSKKLNIVTWDWFEDCTIKRRCFGAKKYEWRVPLRKPSKWEQMISKWAEMTGVEMSARLRYGAGEMNAGVNGNVKGKARTKGKTNDKSKGKTLSPVEQELAKAQYTVYHTESTVYDVVLTIPGALKKRNRIRLYHNMVTSKSIKPAIATTTNVYAATRTNSTSATLAKTTYIAGADMGSSWETAYEAFVGFLEAKTEVAFEKLMNGVQGEIVNGWTVLRNGEGGSVLHWVQVGVKENRAVAQDKVTLVGDADGQEAEVEEEGADNAEGSETGSMKDFIDDASISAESEHRTHPNEEVDACNDPSTTEEVEADEINHDSSLMEDDAQSSVLSSVPDDAFQIEEQNKESEDDDDMPLRHTRARTIASKKDVPPPSITRNVGAAPAADESDDDMPLSRKRARRDTTQKKVITKTARQAASASAAAVEEESVEEDDMPRLHKRARRMPPTKKIAAKTTRQAAITAISENEDQDNDESESESEDLDVDVSDYENDMLLSRNCKQTRKVPPPKKVAAQPARQSAKAAASKDKEMDYDDYDDGPSSRKRARRVAPPKKAGAQKKKKQQSAVCALKRYDGNAEVSARSKRASKRQAAKMSASEREGVA